MLKWFSRSIKRKLIILFSLTLILVISLLGINSYHQSSEAISGEVEQALEIMAQNGVELLNKEMELIFQTLDHAREQQGMGSMLWFYQQSVLQDLIEQDEFNQAGIIDMEGNVQWSDGEEGDFSELAPELMPDILDGKIVVSGTFLGEANFFISFPIMRNEEDQAGSLVALISPSFLEQILSPMGHGESGYAYIVDSEGTFLAHDDSQMVQENFNFIHLAEEEKEYEEIANVIYQMTQREEGIGNYNLEQTPYLIGFAPVGDFPWSLGIIANEEEVLAGVSGILTSLLWGSLIILSLGIAIAYFIGNTMALPIRKLGDFSQKMATGNLAVSLTEENFNRSDEIGDLARSFIQLKDDLREMIKTVQDEAHKVEESTTAISSSSGRMSEGAENQAASMEELTATMEEMEASIQEVADNIQEVSNYSEQVTENALETNKSLEKTAKDLQEASQQAQETAQATENISRSLLSSDEKGRNTLNEMEKTTEITQQGNEQINKTIKDIEEINTTVSSLAEVIKELGNSADKIGEIIELIDDISEQTNLLALNASIEAARAGEHGRGFAVVAGAIGDLASKSQDATQDIGKLIEGIQQETNKAVESSEEGTRKVEEGSRSVQIAGEAFNSIQNAVELSRGQIQEIVTNLTEQADHSQKVNKTVQNMNELIQEISTAGENQAQNTKQSNEMMEKLLELVRNVAASSQEQAASSDEVVKTAENVQKIANENADSSQHINNSSKSLEEMAQNLRQLTESFTIDNSKEEESG